MKENRKEHRQDFCYNKKRIQRGVSQREKYDSLSLLALSLTLDAGSWKSWPRADHGGFPDRGNRAPGCAAL